MATMAPEGVRSTPRDIRALRWLGEQYGAPLDLYGALLGRFGDRPVMESSRRVLARYHAARLERLGWAGRRWTVGQRWIVPSSLGLKQAGLPFEAWEPVGWKLEHIAACGRLRLYLEDRYPEATWESERLIRHRWRQEGSSGLRIPDGILTLPSGGKVAVELELHRKAADRYPHILHAISPEVSEVWWFAPASDAAWLEGVLGRLDRHGRPHTVVTVPGAVTSP